jgi:hypothetical protein
MNDVVDVIGAWTVAYAGTGLARRHGGASVPHVGYPSSLRQGCPTFSPSHDCILFRLHLLDDSHIAMAKPLIVPALKRHTATVIVAHGLGDSGAGWYASRPLFVRVDADRPQDIPRGELATTQQV